MAAALFRTRFCVTCFHREWCRMVWRPQAALFSSKPLDRKQPRRTHIKRAKPQPAVDVAQLLEQLFSHPRPATAPPAGKARPSEASSTSSQPSPSSSAKVSTANAPPETPVSVFSAASGFSSVADSSPTGTTPASSGPSAEETKVETAAEPAELNTPLPPTACTVEQNAESSSFPAATVEPIIETIIESPVDHILPPVETPETGAAVVEGPVEPTVDAAAEEVSTKPAGEEALIETTIEAPVDVSHVPVETSESGAAVVEGPVESTIDGPVDVAAQKVENNYTEVSYCAKDGPLIETTIETPVEASHVPVETQETGAAVVEGPVESTMDVTVDAAVEEVPTKATDFSHTAGEEALIETTIESPVDHILPPVEAQETGAAVVEGPVESTIDVTVDAAAQKVEPKSTDSGVVHRSHTTTAESMIETPVEPLVEARTSPLETVESRAAVVEGPVESTVDATVDAQAVQTKDTAPVNLSHTAEEETAIESVDVSRVPVDTQETGAAAVEGPVESTIDVTVDAAAQRVEINYAEVSYSAKDGPLIETPIEPAVEARPSPLETLEGGSVVVEGQAVPTNKTDACTAKDDPLVETTIGPEVEIQESSAAVVEGPVEPTTDATAQKVETNKTDAGAVGVSCGAKDDPLVETTIGPAGEPSTAPVPEGTTDPRVGTEAADHLSHTPALQESAPLPLRDEGTVESVSAAADRAEEMTLESVTLHEDEVLVSSLETDELLRTKYVLDEKADKQLRESAVRTGMIGAESKAAAEGESSSEDESEVLTDALSKWDALSEDLQELEGESGALVKELLCRVPAAPSRSTNGAKATAAEAMTLESITLARVKAEVGGLETEALRETRNALEKEADARAKEEKMEVTPEMDDGSVFEDTTEADVLALESISEATAAIEAATSVMLEAMLGSVQGPARQEEVMSQEAGSECEEQRGGVLEAMSLESVTLAEVEAFLDSLEDETLSETADYLETEAENAAGEKKATEDVAVEDVAASEELTEVLGIESLSLSEDLQTDELMEELLFVVPGHVTVTEGPVDQWTERAEGLNDLDPVQRLFLEKIREYSDRRRLNGGQSGAEPGAEPDHERRLSEEVAKLQRLYGGGDLSSFPQFTFSEPDLDPDSK